MPEINPKLVFVGDSHAAALLAGATALGLDADGVSWSGSAWHDGKFALTETGLEPRGLPAPLKAMAGLRARLAKDTETDKGQIVVTTLGFHLGRLVPPFGWNGHQAFSSGEPRPAETDTVSQAFLRDYVQHFRARHLRVARRWSRMVNLVIVAPPPAFSRPSYMAFRDELLFLCHQARLTVFDPSTEFQHEGGIVPAVLLEADGVHGMTEYGARVMEAMVRNRVLDLTLPH